MGFAGQVTYHGAGTSNRPKTDYVARGPFKIGDPRFEELNDEEILCAAGTAGDNADGCRKNCLRFTLNSIDGQPTPLSSFKGKVVLLVNVASRCGYTPQYAGLEVALRKIQRPRLRDRGVPANNFGGRSRARTRKSKPSAPRNIM